MKVLVATDGSEASGFALDWATTLFPGADLHVVAVAELPPSAFVSPPGPPLPVLAAETLGAEALAAAEAALARAREQLAAAGLRPAQTYLRQGEVARAILDVARGLQADLLVVGSRGRGPLARAVLGSVSDALRRGFPGPVLVARAPAVHPRRALPATRVTPGVFT